MQYSADDGKTYQPIFVGGRSNTISLPATHLTASNQARLRVLVSDGFNEAAVVSGQFIVEATAPIVEIGEPVDTMQIRAGVSLRLAGRAIDNARKVIPNNQLKWFSDTTSIGSGSQTDVDSLSPGRHEIRLEATDSQGKKGVARVFITVVGDPSTSTGRNWWIVLLVILVLIIGAVASWKFRVSAR